MNNAIALIKGIDIKPEPLGDVVSSNQAELIVQIANNYGVFKENLTLEQFNAFMAGTLTTPLKSSANVKVAIFIYGLKDANLFYSGVFSRIGKSECILSATGKGPLSGDDITSTMYQMSKDSSKHKALKASMERLRIAKL